MERIKGDYLAEWQKRNKIEDDSVLWAIVDISNERHVDLGVAMDMYNTEHGLPIGAPAALTKEKPLVIE